MTAPTRPRPRRKKSRRGKFLIITLLVLGVLLVAADFALAAAGEYQIAQKMREKLQLREDPSVRINGFPFILQAVRGDYTHIRIDATGVPVRDQLRDLDIGADLRHTRIALSDLINGDTSKAVIDEVEGSVKVKALDLNRLVNQVTPFDKLSIEPDTRATTTTTTTAPGAAEQVENTAPVKLNGTTDLAGKQVVVTAYGVVSVVNGELAVAVDDLQLDDMSLKQLIPTLKDAMNVKVAPGALPFGVTPTAVKVESGAFTLHGKVRDVPLDQG